MQPDYDTRSTTGTPHSVTTPPIKFGFFRPFSPHTSKKSRFSSTGDQLVSPIPTDWKWTEFTSLCCMNSSLSTNSSKEFE